MLRGEFIRGDGLVIPNNITMAGAAMILQAAMANVVPTFFVGLVSGVPETDLLIQDLVEPSIGVNGYARQPIERSTAGWPVLGSLNGENYVESLWLIWTATGGNFNQTIQRMMLVGSIDALTGNVWALSAALPAGIIIGPTTPEADRKFKYRIYLR